MPPKPTFVVNINFDWRLLAGLALVAAIIVFAYSAVGAQESDPKNVNDVGADALSVQPASAADELAEPPTPDCADGQVATINGECVSVDELGVPEVEASEVDAVTATSSGRLKFYLTDKNWPTNKVLVACAKGYHTASLWEILDVSNLSYDYGHPAAHTKADSGRGPPSYWNGWIRTGQASSSSATAGTGNCKRWSSVLGTDRGGTVRLSRTWETAPGEIFTWDATSFGCSITGPVWCMENE